MTCYKLGNKRPIFLTGLFIKYPVTAKSRKHLSSANELKKQQKYQQTRNFKNLIFQKIRETEKITKNRNSSLTTPKNLFEKCSIGAFVCSDPSFVKGQLAFRTVEQCIHIVPVYSVVRLFYLLFLPPTKYNNMNQINHNRSRMPSCPLVFVLPVFAGYYCLHHAFIS
jgi:hypothetical protein